MKRSNSLEGQLTDKQHGSLSQLVSSRYSAYTRITFKELISATNTPMTQVDNMIRPYFS